MRTSHRAAVLAGAAAGSLWATAGVARGAVIASDNASDPAYTAARYTPTTGQPVDANGNSVDFGGQNGGTGFGPWSITGGVTDNHMGDFAGAFINPEGANGGAYSFNLYTQDGPNESAAAGGPTSHTVTAIRPLTGGALLPGQRITLGNVELNSLDSPNGSGGVSRDTFAFLDAAGRQLFAAFATGGGNEYDITDATHTGTMFPNTTYNYQSLDTFTFTLGVNGAYTLGVTGNSTSTFTGAVSTATGGIAAIELISFNGGNSSDFQVQTLAVTTVPEPTSVGAVAVAAGLLARRRGRRA